MACNLLTLWPGLQGVLVLPPPVSPSVIVPPPLWTRQLYNEIGQRQVIQSWFNSHFHTRFRLGDGPQFCLSQANACKNKQFIFWPLIDKSNFILDHFVQLIIFLVSKGRLFVCEWGRERQMLQMEWSASSLMRINWPPGNTFGSKVTTQTQPNTAAAFYQIWFHYQIQTSDYSYLLTKVGNPA